MKSVHVLQFLLLLLGLKAHHIAIYKKPYTMLVLELELIQTQMTQKPMLRAEAYARALRASQNRKQDSV